MDKKRRDNRKLDAAGQALVRDDSHTLREQGRGFILSDVLGSYTGTDEDGERPVQDADDL
ncbi:hypothetical protein [Anaeromassilibacillus sp. SJQ-5]